MNNLITILGPTASGKTKLAVRLANELDGEIISADSRQVYRGMDIGTGKDLSEYTIDGKRIPYHLIDLLEAGERYNVFQFQNDFQTAFQSIKAKGKSAILCGGSGQYILSVLQDFRYTAVPVDDHLREELSKKSDEELVEIFNEYSTDFSKIAKIESHKRLIRAIEINKYLLENKDFNQSAFKQESILFGLDLPIEMRRARISERLNVRLESGLIEEVEGLLKAGLAPESLIYYGLEYKFTVDYLMDRYDFDTFVKLLEIAIHQYAKRQMTFFRKMEKDGLKINWIDGELPLDLQLKQIINILNSPAGG
ncbi:MAG: tRNA (adenosine(37)-N6)-dimethylallyltransferase MiaA [Bacteroidota bacterium]